jgi:cysteine desulfurase
VNKFPSYLDHASTTPVDPRVLDAMLPYFSEMFGNASSNHIYGKQAKSAIDQSRTHVAQLIGAEAKEVYFTSGATESINWAIKGYLEENPEKGKHIITVKTEHKAVLQTCEYLESRGTEVTYLDVDQNGLISLDELKDSIKDSTSMICVMHVNNEIGIIQDIKAIGQIAKENDICFFCDATQAAGKVPIDVVDNDIDLLCLSAHKMNGPKGTGALYIKSGIKLTPLLHGGAQEKGMRGGTYNTPLIVGFGEAARIALDEFDERVNQMLEQRDKWQAYFEDQGLGVVQFKNTSRAPHILSVQVNTDAEDFLMMNATKFAASTGSACNAALMEISHVIKEVGLKKNMTIRISI